MMSALNVYILTFNCGRALPQPDVFAKHFFDTLPSNTTSPDIIALNLQEIAPLGPAFLGGSFLTPYFNAFRKVIKLASTDCSYVNTISRNVGLTAIMIFVRDSLVSDIAYLHTAGVGVGVHQTGNKGAVAVRMGYQIADQQVMQMTFVSAHLAPMEDAIQRRNEDYENIVRGLVFVSDKSGKPVSRDEQADDAPLLQGMPDDEDSAQPGIYSPKSHLFFAGDLNYRTSEAPPTAKDVLDRFPQPTNDVHDPKHFSHLLIQDQLTQQRKQGKTLKGLSEMPIDFPPTYKYRPTFGKAVVLDHEQSSGVWAWHRWPSWCDRILYLEHSSAKVEPRKYRALPAFATSDHRPVALFVQLPRKVVSTASLEDDDIRKNPPYPLDADWKTKRDAARRKEIVVGLAAYLTWTYEGLGLLLATTVGVLGGIFIIRALLQE